MKFDHMITHGFDLLFLSLQMIITPSLVQQEPTFNHDRPGRKQRKSVAMMAFFCFPQKINYTSTYNRYTNVRFFVIVVVID